MIYILDSYPKLDRGHFWVVDGYIRRALRELAIPYTYLNLSAKQAHEEDGFPEDSSFRYRNAENYENYLEESVRFIESEFETNREINNVICVTWLPQFSEIEMEKILNLARTTSAHVVGISLPTPDVLIGSEKENYRYVHEKFFSRQSRNYLWVGENEIANRNSNSNIRFIPEYGEVSEITSREKGWDLSFFGQLSSYRGLSEILFTALFNPKLKIRIKGYSFAQHRTWRPIRQKLFRYKNWRTNPIFSVIFSGISIPISLLRFLPNVSFSNTPFATEDDLDEAMLETRAMFYGAKLPHGSGIMTKSLSAGIPIIWTGWEGQAFSFLKSNFEPGYVKFYEFFLPNRVRRILKELPTLEPKKNEMWRKFVLEVAFLGKLPR